MVWLRKDNAILHIQNKYILTQLSGGIENLPKAHGDLREKQKSLLKSLVHFDKFAKAHDIEYWLDFGTLLGSYRHKGFIPWDDDIDIGMTDDNLKKLRKLTGNPEHKITITPKAKNSTDGDLWFFSNEFGHFDIFAYAITTKKGLDEQISYINWIRSFKFIIPNWDVKILKKYNNIRVPRPENIAQSGLYLVMRTKKKHGSERVTKSNFKAEDIFPLKSLIFEGYTFPVPNNSKEFLATRYSSEFMELPSDFGISHH